MQPKKVTTSLPPTYSPSITARAGRRRIVTHHYLPTGVVTPHDLPRIVGISRSSVDERSSLKLLPIECVLESNLGCIGGVMTPSHRDRIELNLRGSDAPGRRRPTATRLSPHEWETVLQRDAHSNDAEKAPIEGLARVHAANLMKI